MQVSVGARGWLRTLGVTIASGSHLRSLAPSVERHGTTQCKGDFVVAMPNFRVIK